MSPAEQTQAVEPQTLPQLLRRNAAAHPERAALREKEFGLWQTIDWGEYDRRVEAFALGLEALGFEPGSPAAGGSEPSGDVLAVLADNRPEWLIAELAVQSLGRPVLGLYQDSVAEEVEYLLEFAGVRFVVAEDQEQVDKLLGLRAKGSLADLKAIVYFDSKGMRTYDDPLLYTFDSVEASGRDRGADAAAELVQRVAGAAADDIALLAPTSGTTGKPKLAMLTHGNLLSMSAALQEVDPMSQQDELVSLLPLAWIGEQMISMSCALGMGITVNFPEEPDTVANDLREIGPQVMFSPPRVWENMLSGVQVRREDSSRWRRFIFDRALRVGGAAADAERDPDLDRPPLRLRVGRFIAEWTCFVWLRDQLGLRRIRHAYTGGAALGPDVFRFFHSIGVNLKQIYGQTEVSGISVVHRTSDIKYHTVGTPLPSMEVEIAASGEIRTRGPSVFAGYFRNDEATAESLQEGWLCSGDAGYFDDDGHLVVIDRVADVMTLRDGTQFSPQFLENKLKFSPYVAEAVVFGGGDHEFVSSMVIIDFGNAGKWAERNQLAYTTFTDLAQQDEILELVRDHVEQVNADLQAPARVRRFLLLHKELDADDEELTRTRKVRRRFVAQRYQKILRGLTGDGDTLEVENEVAYQDGTKTIQKTTLRIVTLDTGVPTSTDPPKSSAGSGPQSA